MATLEMVEETLQKFDIDRHTLWQWESDLGLLIPVDANGNKQYSHHHINLFKNVKKHLALGRTLDQIRNTLTLPPSETARPVIAEPLAAPSLPLASVASAKAASNAAVFSPEFFSEASTLNPPVESAVQQTVEPRPYASAPQAPMLQAPPSSQQASSFSAEQRLASLAEALPVEAQRTLEPIQEAPPVSSAVVSGSPTSLLTTAPPPTPITRLQQAPPSSSTLGQPQALQLIDRLLNEKESIQARLLEAEKLNSHLYNVNNLFHRKVKELSALVVKLKGNNREEINMKLMDDKAKLHRQLLDAEKARLDNQRERDALQQDNERLQQAKETVHQQLERLTTGFDAKAFIGRWQETATLRNVVFDNFGLHVENTRTSERLINEAPQRCAGNAAIIHSAYEYESNPLWRRSELATLVYQTPGSFIGDLQVDYILDGVVVAQCLYAVQGQRIA